MAEISACAPQANAQIEEVSSATEEVQELVVTPEPATTPAVCDQVNGNVSIKPEIMSPSLVKVTISGLQPGEHILLIYERNLPVDDWRRIKGRTTIEPSEPIGEDGTFEDVLTGLKPLENEVSNQWVIQVVHRQGVACQMVDLTHTEPEVIATPEPQSQTVNGVTIIAANFRIEQNQLMMDTCFDLPDDGDWSIWDVTLKLGDRDIKGSGGFPMDTPIEPTRQTPQRCDTIYFDGLTAGTDFSKALFIVERILAYPREGEECSSAYLAKYQKALDERNTGITVECFIEELGGGGMSGVRVAGKPETMSEEEANAILLDYNFFLDVHGIAGPWTFPFNLASETP